MVVRDAVKAQKRTALWQAAMIKSLGTLHLATADVLNLSRRTKKLALTDDQDERFRISDEIDKEARRIFELLMRSIEELRDAEATPENEGDQNGA